MPKKNRININKELSLKDLINIEEWQKIQDNFSAVTDICIRITDAEGKLIALPSVEPRLCQELIKDPRIKEKICGSCLPTFLGGKGVVDKNLSFISCEGLHNFVVPLRLNQNKVLGYIIVGPVILVMRKQKEEYQKIADELSIDLDNLWDALLEIKLVSFQGMQSLMELIKNLGEYVIKLAYLNKIRKKEGVVGIDSSKLSIILKNLLDVAFEISQADIGSVMSLNEDRKELTIISARGIPDTIVRDAKVRLGEGISGIAAKEGKSFLLDESAIKNNRISPYLNRPYIGTSMVIPLKVENRVVGVMNLGALKTSEVRFNIKSSQLINKLIALVTLAISPIVPV